jgi:type II secretory pathway component PulF
MPLYAYQALNASQQLVSGEVEAASLAEAVAQLETQRLSIQSIGSAPLVGENPFAVDGRDQAEIERAALEKHLLHVIERGRDLLPALRAYALELPAGGRRRQLESVLRTLERGDAAEAARALTTLPGYWIPLLGAATTSRDPERILREFVRESEQAVELQRQWWLGLAYPALLGALALAVLVALSIFIIPVFHDIFLGFGIQLPPLTTFVLSTAELIASGRIVVAVAVALGSCLLLYLAAQWLPAGLRTWCSERVALRWGRATALARFAQFTADLLEAEFEAPQAVRLAGMATGNAAIERAAGRAAGGLRTGGDVTHRDRNVLTFTILHALGSGERRARVRLLREIGACYAERARRRFSWTRGIVEPLAIVVIGLVVGTVVLALFMPLISLVQGLS